MKLHSLLFAVILLFSQCDSSPKWTDSLTTCLSDEDIDLLTLAKNRFEKVISEKFDGSTIGEKYKSYVKEIAKKDMIDGIYHELLIKETTKKMQASDLYEKIWQKSDKWHLNDRRGSNIYLINGYADVPTCLSSATNSAWLKAKVRELEISIYPFPSNLANEILNTFSPKDYDNEYHQLFIAISLCYTQSLIYYDKN